MEYLLAGVLVVDELTVARELSRDRARGVRIVTLDGDVINPSGAMTGGHNDASRSGGFVGRKMELDRETLRMLAPFAQVDALLTLEVLDGDGDFAAFQERMRACRNV